MLALHLTPFQQTVDEEDSAVTHSNCVSSMHDQIPPKRLSWAEPRPRVSGISHMAGRMLDGGVDLTDKYFSLTPFFFLINL